MNFLDGWRKPSPLGVMLRGVRVKDGQTVPPYFLSPPVKFDDSPHISLGLGILIRTWSKWDGQSWQLVMLSCEMPFTSFEFICMRINKRLRNLIQPPCS